MGTPGNLSRRRLSRPTTALALFAGAVVLIVCFALLAAVLIRLAPQWLTDTEGLSRGERDEARARARTALFALLAGLIALVGAIYTARTFALNRRGQITERFTRAIDQLGNDKIEIRLGGIYALERIAHESPDEHGPILEVLTAYVRENASWPPRAPRTRAVADPASPAAHPVDEDHGAPEHDDPAPEASVDVKAILTVLSRRALRHEYQTRVGIDLATTNLRGIRARNIGLRRANLAYAQLQEADLGGADLQEADLRRADLWAAKLGGAELQGAYLGGAQLQSAELGGADLQGAYLGGADLRSAHLREAQLEETDLGGADLRATELGGARLQRAKFAGADLEHADLSEADLRAAKLGGARLRRADLSGADLQGADLRGADLQGADLRGADLQGADLRYADLQGAKLGGAQLQGANLGDAHLQGAYVGGAICDSETSWPSEFAWRDAGVNVQAE